MSLTIPLLQPVHNQDILFESLHREYKILSLSDFTAYFQKARWVPRSSVISQQHNHKYPHTLELLPHLPLRFFPSPKTPKKTKSQASFFSTEFTF